MNEMIHNNFDKTVKANVVGDQLDFSFVLASSVHDMKNSLGMLLSSLEETIKYSDCESQEQQERFSILQYEATRINAELIQLLSLYRFQHQPHALQVDENYMHDTIEDQIARNDMLFTTQNIEVIIDCDPDLVWYYDSDLMGNVIHNVLVNGCRYAKTKIRISAAVEHDFLAIRIEDDGDGFPEGMIDAASLESDAHRDGNSTQLGLFFAAKIAQFHQQKQRHGYIRLSNDGELDGGVFTIVIP